MSETRGAGIRNEPFLPVPNARWVWGIGLSLLLHLLVLTASLTFLPALFGRLGSRAVAPDPQVLTFRLRERIADVDEASRVPVPPATPLVGRFDSEARDRVPGDRDTPFPAGGLARGENTLPGEEPDPGSAGRGGAETGSAGRGTAVPAPTGSGLADALGSEIALLTGKAAPRPRPGRGAGTDASEDVGALQFGEYSFSTRAWNYEPYWAYMRERLYANWHPPAAYKDYGIIQGGWTLVRAVLDRSGRLRDARILGEKGHVSLHPASFAAMQGAAPFRPLPADFPDDSLVVTVRFVYLPPGATQPPAEWP